MAAIVSSARTLVALVGAAAIWIAVNLVLARMGIEAPDPYPFRWLQRASIVVNLTLILIVFNARRARTERETKERAIRERARRELLETIVIEAMRARGPSAPRERH